MFDDSAHDILIAGLAAARAKEYDLARHYLEWYLRLEPPLELRMDALLWMVEISTDFAEKRNFLDEALAIDPSDPRARRRLAVMQGKLDPALIVDPDRLPVIPAPADPANADATRFTCPNCGGRMVYTPNGQGLVCEYCSIHPPQSTGGNPPGAASAGLDFTVAMATARGHIAPVQQHVLTCKGCGASFILPPRQLTLTCPYCESNYVLQPGEHETRQLVAPGGVIPFCIAETATVQALRAWIDELNLKQTVKVAGGHGLYLPAWSFDIDGQVDWHCRVKVGRNQWTGQDEWEQRDDLELVDARGLLISASARLPAACRPALAGYNLKEIAPYSEQYLVNWPAETYQKTVGDASLEARELVFKREQEEIKNKLLLQQVRDLTISSLGIVIETYSLVLLPAWLTSFTVQDKRYDLMVNGQTGSVTGARPTTGLAGFLERF